MHGKTSEHFVRIAGSQSAACLLATGLLSYQELLHGNGWMLHVMARCSTINEEAWPSSLPGPGIGKFMSLGH